MNDINYNSDFHVFNNGISMGVLLKFDKKSKIYKCAIKRRKVFNLDNKYFDPHLSLHIININNNHPLSSKFIKNFPKILKECFINKLNSNLELESSFRKYELIGDNYKHFAKIFKSNNKHLITQFRICLYKSLETKLNVKFIRHNKLHNDYYIYKVNNRPLYAIKKFYHGINNWKSHISLLKLSEKSNNGLSVKDRILKKKKYSKFKNILPKDFQLFMPKRCPLNKIQKPLLRPKKTSLILSIKGKKINENRKIL